MISLSSRIYANLCGKGVLLTEFSANFGRMFFKESSSERCTAIVIVAGSTFLSFIITSMMFIVIPFTSFPSPVRMGVGFIYILAMLPLLAYMSRFIGFFMNENLSDGGDDKVVGLVAAELAFLLTAIALFIQMGTFDLQSIVVEQSPLPWFWNVAGQPLSLLLFILMFSLRMNVPGETREDFPSFFTSHLYELMASITLALLFLGGWQVPFLTPEAIILNAVPMVVVSWPIVAVILSGVGMWRFLSMRGGGVFGKKSLLEGMPPFIAGITLFALFIVFGDWALSPWAKNLTLQSVQILSMIFKIILFYLVIVCLRLYLEKYWGWLLDHTWSILLPIALINVLMAAVVSPF